MKTCAVLFAAAGVGVAAWVGVRRDRPPIAGTAYSTTTVATFDRLYLSDAPPSFPLTHVVRFDNRLDRSLVVRAAARTCSCVAVDAWVVDEAPRLLQDRIEVPAGSSVFVRVSLTPRAEAGTYNHGLTVEVGEADGGVVGREAVTARYEVLSPIQASPTALEGPAGLRDFRLDLVAHLPAGVDPGIPDVTDVGGFARQVRVEPVEDISLSPTVRRLRWVVTGVIRPPAAEGSGVDGEIGVSLPGRPGHRVRVPYRYWPRGTLNPAPEVCSLGLVGPGAAPVSRAIFLNDAGGGAFEIAAVEGPPGMTATWPPGAAVRHKVLLTFVNPAELPDGSQVVVRAAGQGTPEVRIPIRFVRSD